MLVFDLDQVEAIFPIKLLFDFLTGGIASIVFQPPIFDIDLTLGEVEIAVEVFFNRDLTFISMNDSSHIQPVVNQDL